MLSIILPLLALFFAAPTQPSCNPIAGWEQVASNKKLRFVVLGEMHGTNEMPQIFLDAVCQTSGKRPVVVALELPENGQSAINSFLASNGDSKAKQAFLATDFWTNKFKDGRSSEAMFRLVDDLRRYYQEKKITAVIAFQPVIYSEHGSAEAYEKRMAEIITTKLPRKSTALVLVGNVHAMRTKLVRPSTQYLPMAGHLPKKETISFDIKSGAGSSAWVCTGPAKCGATVFGGKPGNTERGVQLIPAKNQPYDGQLFLGAPTTASPPQEQGQ